ncbi:MAG: TetR/AcrR family transcriptional regulator [Bacillota bacterium]|nr:TetR/AcrR family transcriptional regulator [Bacillota bacterium]
MPKQLFFTLSSEKQNRIKAAALAEFSEHQYHEASINQIIKMADISRGSFYQYFDDKEDLYFFLIESFLKIKMDEFLKNYAKDENTNVFTVNRQVFISILSMISDEKYHGFFNNLFLSLTYELEKELMRIVDNMRDSLLSNTFKNALINIGEELPYLKELLQIIALIDKDLLARKVIENLDNEQIIEIYDLRMELLRSVREIKMKKYMEDMK